MNHLDSDQLVEQTEEKSISEIFRQDGESYFRELETEVLKTLQDYDNFVLSTGGGIVLREENVLLLKTMGPLLLLWAAPEVIFERVRSEQHRPLLKVEDPLAEIKRILAERQPVYERSADLKVETEGKSVDQVTAEIIGWINSRKT